MMNKPNFLSILDRPASSIEQPVPLPAGTYLTTVIGMPRYDKSTKKGTEFVEFTHQVIAAADDVDVTELEESGGLTNKEGLARTVKNTYYITEDAAWRLKEFLEHCGFDFEDNEMTLREAAENTANREVYIYVRHEPSDDGTRTFARIYGTAAV